MGDFYAARSGPIPPLPWSSFPPPFPSATGFIVAVTSLVTSLLAATQETGGSPFPAGFVNLAALAIIAPASMLSSMAGVRANHLLPDLWLKLAYCALLLGGTGLALGALWSVPTTGLLAGLGMGGLAIAFASKETLSNVFGAGILLTDRPFQTGGRIIAGDINGWVEAVSLRSTRIRMLDDSIIIVPNGKLADMSIINRGARRRQVLSTTLLVTSGGSPD